MRHSGALKKEAVGVIKKGTRKAKKDISKEPEMMQLKEIMEEMTERERERTIGYLRDLETPHAHGLSKRQGKI